MAFLRAAPLKSSLRAAFKVDEISHCRDFLHVLWKDGARSKFSNIWLRTSVRDDKFFDAGGLLYRLEDYSPFLAKDSHLTSAEYCHEEDGILKVNWSDHSTTFNSPWLRAQDTDLHDPTPHAVSWTGETKLDNFFEYSRLEKDMEAWMECLRKYGVAYMTGIPKNEEGVSSILHSMGRIRQRYHPTDILDLTADPQTAEEFDGDAYGVKPHHAHVDHGYYLTPSKIACLLASCYKPVEYDTVNFFVDHVKITEDLQEEDPEAFELLSTVPVRTARRRLEEQEKEKFGVKDSELHIYQTDTHIERPLVYFDDRDAHYKIRFTLKQCGFESSSHRDPTRMKMYFKAYERLRSMLCDPKYHQKIVIREGMAALYDNTRVCHGRGGIHPKTQRTLLIADVVAEVWYSRLRLLMGRKAGLHERWLYGCSDKALELLADRYEK